MSQGAAAVDGRLKRGDQILSVNGESLQAVTHEQAVTILKKQRGTVTLDVLSWPGRPDPTWTSRPERPRVSAVIRVNGRSASSPLPAPPARRLPSSAHLPLQLLSGTTSCRVLEPERRLAPPGPAHSERSRSCGLPPGGQSGDCSLSSCRFASFPSPGPIIRTDQPCLRGDASHSSGWTFLLRFWFCPDHSRHVSDFPSVPIVDACSSVTLAPQLSTEPSDWSAAMMSHQVAEKPQKFWKAKKRLFWVPVLVPVPVLVLRVRLASCRQAT